MTYQEVLLFISYVLTSAHEINNKKKLVSTLTSNKINWDEVVRVSTQHLVFTALYCNLKREKLLNYIPKELVIYMEEIYSINKDRNQKIIFQVKELNKILLSNNINAIFLKGAGNLIEGLYHDISERMVGDIDLICSINDYQKALKVFYENGYRKFDKDNYNHPTYSHPDLIHHPRLIKDDRIAAIELHKELTVEKYSKEFNYELIYRDIQKINNVNVLSFKNQLNISIISRQINDHGYFFNDIGLKNAYDVYLLSKKIKGKISFSEFKKLKTPLNCFLASCYYIFGKVSSLQYEKTKKTNKYLKIFNYMLLDEDRIKIRTKKKFREIFLKERLMVIFKSIFDKRYRNWIFKRFSDKNWRREKLKQFRLKNK